jgi:hypothetical protein
LFQHACREAHRLGLQINMNNDAGWCGSGGPWITPELSMQKVVWSETVVEGGKQINLNLPQPPSGRNYYRDIALLAMPAPASNARIPDFENKAALHKQDFAPAPASFPEPPSDAIIARDRIMKAKLGRAAGQVALDAVWSYHHRGGEQPGAIFGTRLGVRQVQQSSCGRALQAPHGQAGWGE